MSKAEIIIGADIVASAENQDIFRKGVPELLIGEKLWNAISKADMRIYNLETAVCKAHSKIKKAGPHIRMEPCAFAGVSALKPTVLSIANNHVMDYGADGLSETIDNITKNNIEYIGAGRNLAQAACPKIFSVNGIRIGIYSCAEHEFSIAGDDTPGCNPYDPLSTFDQVQDLKGNCEYVIVLYHGGKEYYRYPSPNLQRVCRKLAEKGADLVVCQHSHCVGAVEKYGSSTIVYGQGNFLFYETGSEEFLTGTLIKLTLDKEKIVTSEVEYLPLRMSGYTVVLAEGDEAKEILQGLQCRSRQIEDQEFVMQNYALFAKNNENNYFYNLAGRIRHNLFFKILNRITNRRVLKNLYRKDMLLINMFECEAHRELIIRILKDNAKIL